MRRSILSLLPLITGSLLVAPSGGTTTPGAEFNLSCDADEVLVGIGGRQGWWMTGIAARCRAVEPVGRLGTTIRSTAYAGGTDGAFRTFDCRPNEVMVGFAGMQGDNGYVLHVHELLCAPWRADTRTAGTPARTVRAFDSKPGPGEALSDSCPAGRAGTRLRGRAGRYLDRLVDVGCSYASGAALPAQPDGST